MECGHYTHCDPSQWYVGILVISRQENVAKRLGAGEMFEDYFETGKSEWNTILLE